MPKVFIGNLCITLDLEDWLALPIGHYWKFDKDGYALLYWYCGETRREENCRLSRWVMHNPPGLLVDHINGQKRDNRKANLRACTAAENSRNRGKNRTNSSGQRTSSRFKGVCRSVSGRWQSQIKAGGRSVHIGTFSSEEEAARAYDSLAQKYYGDFAYLNFPPMKVAA